MGRNALSADDSKQSPPRQAPPSSSPSGRAYKSPFAVILFLSITAIGLAGDLWTKHAVFSDLLGRDIDMPRRVEHIKRVFAQEYGKAPTSREILHGMGLSKPFALGVELKLSTNPGVVFGLAMPRWLVQVATAVTILMVGGFFATSSAADRWLHIATGFILAGALGNLYDRLFSVVALPGVEPIRYQVRDFIDCSALWYPWVFNVADAWLVTGVAMVFIHWLRSVPSQLKSPSAPSKKHA